MEEYDDLISKLEQAEEGSRELSDEIALAAGWETDKGWWRAPGEAHYDSTMPPDFSRSLDAKLPGENIVQVRRLTGGSGDGKRWEARHWDGKQRHYATAKTEPLARRAAALKAREGE